MSPGPSRTKSAILNAAYALFYRHGFARVSMDAIAARAGKTKRTLYYHFPSKDDIAGEVLESQHGYLLVQFEGWIADRPDSAEDLVETLFRRLAEWSEDRAWLGSGFTRIATELADMPGHPARVAARRHKADVERWLAEQLSHRGVVPSQTTARSIMTLIEGAMSLTLIHGDTGYIRSAGHSARKLLP